jgi:mRNA interferase RelE/StbE
VVISYRVTFSSEAGESLSRLDKKVAQRILNRIKWLSQHISDVHHTGLKETLRGAYKLRVGDYRVIYELDHESTILVIREIGHRSEVYRIK